MKRDKILKKILKKVKTGTFDNIEQIKTEELKLDFSDVNIKIDIIDNGKVMIVHDVPIAKEIVQPYMGDNGKFEYHYKPKDAIEGIESSYSPISISHPNKLFNNMTEDNILNETVGYLLNGYTDNDKHYVDLYLFVDKAPEFLMDNIKNSKSNDVSIGFNTDIKKEDGEFNGMKYDHIQTNIRLDHLAILKPTERGRASFSQGVGIGADSDDKNKIGGHIMTDEFKDKYVDSVEKLGIVNSELKTAKDSIEAKDIEIAALKDSRKDYDDMKAKADKFDAKVKSDKEEEDAKVEKLKAEILKKSDTEDTKALIKGMDSKQLGLYLKQFSGNSNGLPAHGKADAVKSHPAFAARDAKLETLRKGGK